jgi:para-aminobenzoate synthetase component I
MILNVYKKIETPCRPEDIAYLLSDQPYLSFLDSSLQVKEYGKFSYISWDPAFLIRSRGVKNEFIDFKNNVRYFSYLNPVSFIRQVLDGHIFEGDDPQYRTYYFDESTGLGSSHKHKLSFKGGFIGYLSYDLKNHMEKLPAKAKDDVGLFHYNLSFYDFTIAFDHAKRQWYFAKNYAVNSEKEFDEKRFLQDAAKTAELISKAQSPQQIKAFISEGYRKKKIKKIDLVSNFKKSDYIKSIQKAKEHIHNGDVYQINLTQRFCTGTRIEPKDIYYILRLKNPAPFSCFLTFEDFHICSSSPERFLYKSKDYIQTRPIKGTRPRGSNAQEDAANRQELRNSPKDRAELNMIVDLERNDLGKFCEYGTVKVKGHAVIEKFAKVFHSVSTVEGRIRKGYGIADIIKATFPGGSITGAPKIRAMQIIDDLEPNTRGIYTGSIGYISIDSTMDLNIAIRTMVATKSMTYYNVGGGIVEDSRPYEEYEETLHKGAAIKDTLDYFKYFNLDKDIT